MLGNFFRIKRHSLLVGFCVASTILTVSSVNAETVNQAMAYAFKNSPQMRLEKEKLKLSDESIISAQAGLMPTLNGELSFARSQTKIFLSGSSNPASTVQMGLTATLNASYNLWDNGITENRIEQAKIGRSAQQDMATLSEQDFLIQVFTIYVDVLRDSALLNVQIKNFNVMSEQQKASEARFQVGEATATDVALAKARKSSAISTIASSKAQLDMSRAVYEQIIGHKPTNLRQPKNISRLLPKSLRSAIASAEKRHPALKSLKKSVLSAEKSVQIAEAGLLPSASAFGTASAQRAYDGSAAQASLTIGAKLSVPIYNGGIKYSQTRQEKIKVAQARLNLTISRARIVAGVKSRWNTLKASKIRITADDAQIRASRAVLNGIRAEAEEGVRTSFDVLNSEKELLSAKVQAIVSKRAVLLSQMQLLSSIGSLTATKLGIR